MAMMITAALASRLSTIIEGDLDDYDVRKQEKNDKSGKLYSLDYGDPEEGKVFKSSLFDDSELKEELGIPDDENVEKSSASEKDNTIYTMTDDNQGNEDTDDGSKSAALEIKRRQSASSGEGNNIAFELPDVSRIVKFTGGDYQLEAFKSTSNDRIISQAEVKKYPQLNWVSIGHPMFLKSQSPKNSSVSALLHFLPNSFYTRIQMMTPAHQELLQRTARRKYGIDLDESQFLNLILSKFDCLLYVFSGDGSKYVIKGSVKDFKTYPLRMDFSAPQGSVSRTLLISQLDDAQRDGVDPNLEFECVLASSGKQMQINTLTLTSEQIQRAGLEDKLFGPSSKSTDTVFVTRNQLSDLSQQMYTSLNIVEDYQMPAERFSEAFVNGLIEQVATKQFESVSIDSVFESFSKYGFSYNDDLKPDVIKRDAGKVLKVEKVSNVQRIVLNTEAVSSMSSSRSQSASVGFGFGPFRASMGWASSNAQASYSSSRSLSDQLKQLNTESQNDVQWDIEGERVVPKSLNVAKIQRSAFSKTLTFNRVRIQSTDAPFQREFSMYTDLALSAYTPESLLSEVNAKISNMSTEVNAKFSNISTEINSMQGFVQAVNRTAIRSCRICMQYITMYVPRNSYAIRYHTMVPTCREWSNAVNMANFMQTSPNHDNTYMDFGTSAMVLECR